MLFVTSRIETDDLRNSMVAFSSGYRLRGNGCQRWTSRAVNLPARFPDCRYAARGYLYVIPGDLQPPPVAFIAIAPEVGTRDAWQLGVRAFLSRVKRRYTTAIDADRRWLPTKTKQNKRPRAFLSEAVINGTRGLSTRIAAQETPQIMRYIPGRSPRSQFHEIYVSSTPFVFCCTILPMRGPHILD